MKRIIAATMMSILCFSVSAQIRYTTTGITIGNTEQIHEYSITIAGNGMYFKHTNNRFLQLDVLSTGAPRIAGHNNQIVFYNTLTRTFNNIQVQNVLSQSDMRFKTDIKSFNRGKEIISRLRPVSYNFIGEAKRSLSNQYTGNNAEIGLLAQDLEEVLPNLVYTDEEGHKLVNYMALIPVLIDAVQSLQTEVDMLKTQLNGLL